MVTTQRLYGLDRESPRWWIKAYCTACIKAISVAGLGISALDIHAKGKKHLLKCPTKNQSKI